MPSFLQWVSSTADRPRKYRIYVILGEDATLRADALDRVLAVTKPQEQEFLHVGYGEGEATAAQVWDEVATQPMPGVKRRLLVVHHADKLRRWGPLKAFIEGAAVYPETTLVLVTDRTALGKRVRNREKSLPGAPVWETSYEDWEQLLSDYSSAAVITCGELSLEQAHRGKPSPVGRWLSLRLPVTQAQAAYLWRRVGASSLLARDVVRGMRLVGINDATALSMSEFVSYVDSLVGKHGPEDLVDQLLFERRADAMASVLDRDFDRTEWSRILGLLGQRLDWLGALHGALATSEKLDQVMRRLQIPRHLILYYAHRDDVRHNVARRYDANKVSRARKLLAEFDAALGTSGRIPAGFGPALVASW